MSTAEVLPDTATANPKPRQLGAWDLVLKVLQPLASLKLTVTLFALSMVLVFFGTLAQMDNGIWTVVERYFWSYWVQIDLKTFSEFCRIFLFGMDINLSGLWFPFPAGKTIGGLMFINLLAAHTIQLSNLIRGVYKTAQKGKEVSEIALVLLKRSGIYILHGGLLLLFVGEYITREFQVEQQMRIVEGGSSSMTYDTRNHELAFITSADKDHNHVTVIPRSTLLSALKKQSRIVDERLPFDVQVLAYYPNSDLVPKEGDLAKTPPFEVTSGLGLSYTAVPLPEVSGVDMGNNVDSPSCYVRLYKKNSDDVVGLILASTFSDSNLAAKPVPTPSYQLLGQSYNIVLRLKQYHKTYAMKLNSFTYEQYIGTQLAKNYASHVQLVDEPNKVDRLATISMNNPLRYSGETFYQHQFTETPAGKVTTLQVVDNPGWTLPYVSCVMVTLGMTIHFMIVLITFLIRMLRGTAAKATNTEVVEAQVKAQQTVVAATPNATKKQQLLPIVAALIIGGLAVLSWINILLPSSTTSFKRIGSLPVIDGGRIKPLDTVARTQLRIVSHREEYKDSNNQTQPALKWYLESAMVKPDELGPIADGRIFRIENDQVRELLNLKPREGLRYSLREMSKGFEAFDQAVENALKKDTKNRDLYDTKVLELSRQVKGYFDLCLGKNPLQIPPEGDKSWRSVHSLLGEGQEAGRQRMLAQARERGFSRDIKELTPEQQQEMMSWLQDGMIEYVGREPAFLALQDLLFSYRAKDTERINKALDAYSKAIEGRVSPEDRARASFEAYLNEKAIYYYCDVMYGIGLFLCLMAWLVLPFNRAFFDGIRWGTLILVLTTFVAHGFMMLSRMYLMERPLVFVTNLYSSAVFIGLVAVLVCLVLEFLFPLSIGNLVGCALGFFTCNIAHNLALAGDTLEMMQAVLDTNLWLATHVTTVTFGYAATYVAGVIALLYLIVSVIRDITQSATGTKKFPLIVETFEKAFSQLIYGVVCLAMFMSFVGTVLGGIWADQSWGRFWGWDPKENGAVLIVIWNALILHARWAGLVKTRGIAVLAIVGNMITTWSWFGTNQLSVGLHAYGFNKDLVTLCTTIWVSHMAIIGSALLWMVMFKATHSTPNRVPTS